MPIDLTKIPNTRRLRLIRLGLQFGSQDTLDQANQTLAAYKAYAATLKTSGFGAKQAQELTDARDGLLAAGVGRQAAKGKKKATGEAYVAAFKQASGARIHARTVLAAVREDLEANGGEDAAVQVLSVALRQTRAAPRNAEPLAQQLALLVDTFENAQVAAAGADQGGPEAVAELTAAIDALRKADQEDAGVRGTPAETETLDTLDGIIVELVRRARRAAVAAARKNGHPALVEAFKLDQLYRSKGGAPAEGEEDVEEENAESGPGNAVV